MIRTSETTNKKVVPWPNAELLHYAWDRHNPFNLNHNQTIQKWTARFQLTTSNAVPVLQFKPENVFFIDDLYANGKGYGPGQEKPETHEIMTDGCGLMNRAAFDAVLVRMEHGGPDGKGAPKPVAIQFRMAGAKGVVILDPDDASDEPKIWLRKSQVKVNFDTLEIKDDPLNASRLIFEVVRLAVAKYPTRINGQVILNLVANTETPKAEEEMIQTMLRYQRKMLQEIHAAFTAWETSKDLVQLVQVIDRTCAVTSSWRAEAAAGEARAKGLQYFDKDDYDDDDELDEFDFVYTGNPEIDDKNDEAHIREVLAEKEDDAPEAETVSGTHAHMTKGATALRMLYSAFNPTTMPRLRTVVCGIKNDHVRGNLKKYRLEIPCSAEAIVVPDPTGTLDENEIFYASSQPMTGPDGSTINYLTGQVLVFRYPIRLATDVQKVTAVYRPELEKFRDVFVFSTKGSRSLASKLAGGDYDGDRVVALFDPALVDPFFNDPRDDHMMDVSPEFMAKYFERHTEDLSTMLTPQWFDIDTLEGIMLGACDDRSKIGHYSSMHELAQCTKGYKAHYTNDLGKKFNVVMDGAKTGYRIKPSEYHKDERWQKKRIPAYKYDSMDRPPDSAIRYPPKPSKDCKDPPKLGVLERLWEEGNAEAAALEKQFTDFLNTLKAPIDKHCAQRWSEFCQRLEKAGPEEAAIMRAVHDAILHHCTFFMQERRKLWTQATIAKQSGSSIKLSGAGARALEVTERESKLASARNKQLRADFAQGPKITSAFYDETDIRQLTASCAFSLCITHDESNKIPDLQANFAFDFAFHDLCKLKAREVERETGVPLQVVQQHFLNHMSVRYKG
ncbi:hypothetical protein EXIGLDRAFT_146649 [Exidia glandulosa HHB12029]|uniref:RNA-dependent RNA polymerase n=1 Tax=Exidia glandulosa HHB12029 TaxID=1314781 RepID=A0A165FSS4_EXIGL|nr:hypothetical protein EXIGLDRAFT_146649 [Exidia glandulosa HHB12029]